MAKIELTKEQKRQAIQEIREYFARERDEELGNLAGEIILDFIADKLGPYFYNQAVNDVYEYMKDKMEDLYGLMK